MAYAQTARYISISTPFGADKLHVRALRGEERISGLFHFFLELQSEDNALEFSKIVGKNVTVSIKISDDTTRYINGIVGRFVQGGADARFTTYFMELHPWLWLMTMARDCRIYQNKSAKDIVTAIFTDLGFTDYTDSTKATYNALEYCVQYNETAFAFVSRLMESAGMFYFFTHADGKHTLILGDDSTAFSDCGGAATVDYGPLGNDIIQTAVLSCTVEEMVIPGSYAVDDFGFETPSTDLMGSTDSTVATNGSKRRIYEYPGGIATKDDADAVSKLRLEAEEAPRQVLRGESLAAGFTPGGKTTLQKHYRTDVNAAYVITRVSHNAVEDSYANSFEAIPSANTYRPRRTTRKPVIPGTQTAIVVGKSGEEIWTDKYGRVKVQFHWDQKGTNDENSSCWIRVAQGWAGTSWGSFFLPRVGQEVVVSFLDGDPDRPLITGSVYNAEQTTPYTLPTDQTKSTIKSNTSKGGSGYNEIRFEDKKDSEEIAVQAQKDMNVVINNNETRKVGFTKKSNGDQTVDIYNNRTVTLDQGNDTLEIKTGNLEVKVDKGNDTLSVKGTRDVTVTGAETHTNKDAYTQKVTSDYTLKVSGNLTIDVTGTVTIKSGSDMTLQSTAGITQKATADVAISGMNIKNTATTEVKNVGMNITNNASANLNSQGAMVATKASGMHNVEASGILTVKGSLVKIN